MKRDETKRAEAKQSDAKLKLVREVDMSEFEAPRSETFVSMGYICGLLQIMPSQLRLAMRDVRVSFSRSVDGVGLL